MKYKLQKKLDQKKCTHCDIDLIFGDNITDRNVKVSNWICRPCINEISKKQYKSNLESFDIDFTNKLCRCCSVQLSEINSKSYDVKTKNYICVTCRREKNKNSQKKYDNLNKSKIKIIQKRRRARMKTQGNSEKIKQIYWMAQRLTINTGVQYDVDHIVPLTKGGKHHEDNLIIMRHDYNLIKGTSTDEHIIKMCKSLISG